VREIVCWGLVWAGSLGVAGNREKKNPREQREQGQDSSSEGVQGGRSRSATKSGAMHTLPGRKKRMDVPV